MEEEEEEKEEIISKHTQVISSRTNKTKTLALKGSLSAGPTSIILFNDSNWWSK